LPNILNVIINEEANSEEPSLINNQIEIALAICNLLIIQKNMKMNFKRNSKLGSQK